MEVENLGKLSCFEVTILSLTGGKSVIVKLPDSAITDFYLEYGKPMVTGLIVINDKEISSQIGSLVDRKEIFVKVKYYDLTKWDVCERTFMVKNKKKLSSENNVNNYSFFLQDTFSGGFEYIEKVLTKTKATNEKTIFNLNFLKEGETKTLEEFLKSILDGIKTSFKILNNNNKDKELDKLIEAFFGSVNISPGDYAKKIKITGPFTFRENETFKQLIELMDSLDVFLFQIRSAIVFYDYEDILGYSKGTLNTKHKNKEIVFSNTYNGESSNDTPNVTKIISCETISHNHTYNGIRKYFIDRENRNKVVFSEVSIDDVSKDFIISEQNNEIPYKSETKNFYDFEVQVSKSVRTKLKVLREYASSEVTKLNVLGFHQRLIFTSFFINMNYTHELLGNQTDVVVGGRWILFAFTDMVIGGKDNFRQVLYFTRYWDMKKIKLGVCDKYTLKNSEVEKNKE